jgi:phosphoglycerate dehydrogenase-like enzyme
MTDTRRSKRPASESTVLLVPEHLMDPVGENNLREKCGSVVGVVWDEAKVAAAIGDVDVVVVRGPVVLSKALIEKGKNLRFISVSGVGLDCVDLAAATARGLPVIYYPGYSSQPVAEYIIGGLFNCARRVGTADRVCRETDFNWARRTSELSGTLISGAKLGVFGMGAIGHNVARMATALGMKVAAYDPHATKWPDNVERIHDIDTLVKDRDFITFVCPLTDETRGMVSAARIRLMKRGTCIVNAARHGIVDEQAMADALKDGHLAFGVVDVFATEPYVWKSPLASAPNCVVTPHLGGVTQTTTRATVEDMAHQIITGLNGKFDRAHIANPAALDAMANS